MSRPNPSSTRNLSLTEELEKLEQSITLTLQEIDHNFSRAHRIVTTSILPIVEQYAEHSKGVWEGTKFWKQFFEASANVSLSGYEELAVDEEEEDTGISHSQGHDTYASAQADGTLHTNGEEHETYDQADDSLLDNGDISGSTPRPPQLRSDVKGKTQFADYPSPYEALKRELKGGPIDTEDEDVTQISPTTPRPEQRLPDMSMTPMSSPFAPTSYMPSTTRHTGTDPLLHRVLDKNYRVQATPHSTRKQVKTPVTKASWRDMGSPMSSPPSIAPQLRPEIFSSPMRPQHSRPSAPRTPGVSLQTPMKENTRAYGKRDEITWDSDSDQDADDVYKELGMSPPKTIQFAVGPSRLLQTPAREASKRIVEDLLMTAGAGRDTDEEESPSMVQMKYDLDDSF